MSGNLLVVRSARRNDAAAVVAEQVSSRRQHLRLSQAELADATGLSQQYISEIERGLKLPEIDTIDRLSKALGLPAYPFCDRPMTLDTITKTCCASRLATAAPTRARRTRTRRSWSTSTDRSPRPSAGGWCGSSGSWPAPRRETPERRDRAGMGRRSGVPRGGLRVAASAARRD